MNVMCWYYSMLTIFHLRIDYIWLPNGQLQMVPMPVPQYGYSYGYPMAMPHLTSPGLSHWQMPAFGGSSAGSVAYGQSSSIQGKNSKLYVYAIFSWMCYAVYFFLLLIYDINGTYYACKHCKFPHLWYCWIAHNIMYSTSLQGLLDLPLFPCHMAKYLVLQLWMVCYKYISNFLKYALLCTYFAA